MSFINQPRGRINQPKGIASVRRGIGLGRGLVFCCYPVGNGFYDAISRQFVSAGSTASSSLVKPIDGSGASAIHGTNSAALTFARQTKLDLVNGAFTIFAEAAQGANRVEGSIVKSFSSGNGFGLDIRFDDGSSAFDSFNVYTGNGTSAGAYTGGSPNRSLVGGPVANDLSYKFTRRFALSLDASQNIRWFAKRKLLQTSAWSGTRLPAASTNRLTSICNNANHKISLLLAWDRVLTINEYAMLYDNPWQVFADMVPFYVPADPTAAGIVESGSAGDSCSASVATNTAITESASATEVSFPAGLVLITESGSASESANGLTTETAAITESSSATESSNGGLNYGVVGTGTEVTVSFGSSTTYFEYDIGNSDGVASAAVVIPSAVFNGSISATTLTVNSVTSGTVQAGLYIVAPGVTGGTLINSGSGSTFNLNKSQNVSSVDMVAGTYKMGSFVYGNGSTKCTLSQQGVNVSSGVANALGGFAQPCHTCLPIPITGSISGTLLTVTAVSGGTIHVGEQIATGGATLSGAPQISSFGTGTGGTGTYTITNPNSVSVSAGTAMTLSTHGGLQYPGQYWTATNKGVPVTDAPIFSDALTAAGTSQLVVVDMGGTVFDFKSVDIGPISFYYTGLNPNNYVRISAYTGTPITVSNNAITTTGATLKSRGYVANTTSSLQQFNIATDVTWQTGSDMDGITSFVMECYGAAMGNIVSGGVSNSPYYSFDYIRVVPQTTTEASSQTFVTAPVITESGSSADSTDATNSSAGESITESASASDSSSGLLVTVAAITETGTATDTNSMILAALAAVTESASVSDLISTTMITRPTITESGNATDSITGTGGIDTPISTFIAALMRRRRR